MHEVIISSIIIAAFGTLAHFLYDISKHNKFIGVFTAVNESTWEHLKLAITPIILYGLADGYVHGTNPNYFLAKLASLCVPVLFIPIVFYAYKAISKKPILPIDILTFFAAVFLSQLTFNYIINLPAIPHLWQYLSCVGVFAFVIEFSILTFLPLKNFIFKDPISHKYGFRGHTETFNIFKKKKKK